MGGHPQPRDTVWVGRVAVTIQILQNNLKQTLSSQQLSVNMIRRTMCELKGKLGDFLLAQSFYPNQTKRSLNKQFSPKSPKVGPKWVKNKAKGSKIHEIRTKQPIQANSYCRNPPIQVNSYCRNPPIRIKYIPTVAVGLNWLLGSYFMNFGPFGLI